MENFIRVKDIEFEDEELNSLVVSLNYCFNNMTFDFCKTCFNVYKIANWFDTHKYHYKDKNNYWYDKYTLLAKFGFDKSAVSRLSNCYLRFMCCPSITTVRLTSYFEDFSPSKLFELLKLSDETLVELIQKDLIKSTMTVKEIRTYIKSLEKGDNKAEKVLEQQSETEEEIPMAYNPKQHYDFDYFESKSKAQLLNIVWELQKEYEKLKGKRK